MAYDICNYSHSGANELLRSSSTLQGCLNSAMSSINYIIDFLHGICESISFVLEEINKSMERINQAEEKLNSDIAWEREHCTSENVTEQQSDYISYELRVRKERIDAARSNLQPFINKYNKMYQTYRSYVNSAMAVRSTLQEARSYACSRGAQIDNAIRAANEAINEFNSLRLKFDTSIPDSTIKPIIED